MKKPLEVCGVSAKPNSMSTGWFKVAELYDGSAVEVPVAILNGSKDGPIVWIQNAVHGDEYVGLGAIQEILRTVDPQELSGALVLIPWVNVQAFRAGVRSAPQDGLDMNRIYPGNPIETAMHLFAHTEIVLDKMFTELLKVADAAIDLHDGSYMGEMSPWIQYLDTGDDVGERARSMAHAAGMDVVWAKQWSFAAEKTPGALSTASMRNNVPTVTMEVGGQGRLVDEEVDEIYVSVMNVLKHLGALEGELVQHGKEEKHSVTRAAWIRANRGGVYKTHTRVNEQVSEGQVVAEVRDAFGSVVEELRAPIDGILIGIRTFGVIASGQYVATIVRPE